MDYLYYLVVFIIVFIIVFIGDFFIMKRSYYDSISNKGKKKSKNNDVFELNYIVSKFKLDKKKLNIKRCLIEFSLINSFIISFTAIVLNMLDLYFIFKIFIGFILLMGLIYSVYEIYGKLLVKKGCCK